MKYIFLVIAVSCFMAASYMIGSNSRTGKDEITKRRVIGKDTVYIHDTLKVIPNEKELQETLIMYYKDGWVDAINSSIDLYNSGKFTSKRVYNARDLAWRKMENKVRSK